MKNKNCQNCGAPINIEKHKCEYCGTSYYDLSCIPFNELFFLKINLGSKEKPNIIMTKAIMTKVEYTMSCNAYPEIELRFVVDNLLHKKEN